MVVKCGECASSGVETWFCADCLEADGGCLRCDERDAAERSNSMTCGAAGGAGRGTGSGASAEQSLLLDSTARADVGREILSQAYQVTDTMTT